MLYERAEPFGTNRVVAKKIQAKFYVDGELMDRCNAVFEEQGVTLSEGMSRLVELLVSAGDTLRPLLLRQAPGKAGRVLAENVLKDDAPVVFSPSILPTAPEQSPPSPPAGAQKSARERAVRGPARRKAK